MSCVPDLNKLEARIPRGGLRRYRGTMVTDDSGALAVNVNGNILPARYADPVVVALGDAVVVDLLSGEAGQGEAVVTGRLTASPRPGRAVVKTVPVGSPTVTVTGTDGVDYTADFVASYTPATGNEVVLAWNAATPTITGKVGATAPPEPPEPPIPPPPPPAQTGVTSYRCTDSSSYWTGGGWDSIAGGAGRVFQGIVYGTSNRVYGSWFYAGSPKGLSGRTITRARVRVPARRAVGASGSPVTIIFQCHTSERRPGGAVALTGPTHAVVIPAGWNGGTLDLPVSFGASFLAGRGLSIVGPDYASFKSRTEDPSSGQITLDWSR